MMDKLNDFIIETFIGKGFKTAPEIEWIPYFQEGTDSNLHLAIYRDLVFSEQPNNVRLRLGLLRAISRIESVQIDTFLRTMIFNLSVDKTSEFLICLESTLIDFYNRYQHSYEMIRAGQSKFLDGLDFKILFKGNIVSSIAVVNSMINLLQDKEYFRFLISLNQPPLVEDETNNMSSKSSPSFQWAGHDYEFYELMDVFYLTKMFSGATKIEIFNFFNGSFNTGYKFEDFKSGVSDIRGRKKEKTIFLRKLINKYEIEVNKKKKPGDQ